MFFSIWIYKKESVHIIIKNKVILFWTVWDYPTKYFDKVDKNNEEKTY